MDHPVSPLRAESADASIVACPTGAHLLSWTVAGVERLYLSELTPCGGAGAIRGGVPVLFPQFGTFGPLGKHGFARDIAWHAVDPAGEVDPGAARLSFALTASAATEQWPYAFTARLDIVARGRVLEMALGVVNDGPEPFSFTAGLHTYFAVEDPAARIRGLGAGRAWDTESTLAPRFTESVPDEFPALDAQDRVIDGATGPVLLVDDVLGAVEVTAQGFAQRVVWNPGPDNGLSDLAAGDERRFVCIEPATVVPVLVEPGGQWLGTLRLALA